MGSTLQLWLAPRLTAEQVQRTCAGLRRQLSTGTVSAVVCRVDSAADDLVTVDAVARLALVTRRAGAAFSLDGPGAELTSLLALVGLRAPLTGLPDDL